MNCFTFSTYICKNVNEFIITLATIQFFSHRMKIYVVREGNVHTICRSLRTLKLCLVSTELLIRTYVSVFR